MKLSKYILGLALIAVGLTSCDQDNIGAIYEPDPTLSNVSFMVKKQYTLTQDSVIEVPVAISRAVAGKQETYNVTISDAYYVDGADTIPTDDYMSLKSNQVTFEKGETMAYVTVLYGDMTKGITYDCEVALSDEGVATADTTNASKSQIHKTLVSVMCDYNWLGRGTCTFIDYTWEDGFSADKVPIQYAEGTENLYRIQSPLAAVYTDDYADGQGDVASWQFYLNDDGSITVPEGASINYWGYQFYWDNRYPSYCYVAQDGNTYDVNFLLLAGSSLYTGGHFVFIWDKPAGL